MSGPEKAARDGPTPKVVADALNPLAGESNDYDVVLVVERKGWTRLYRPEFNFEAFGVDRDAGEVHLYYDSYPGLAPSPVEFEDRSPMSLKSFLWKLEALPPEAFSYVVEARMDLGHDFKLDRSIVRIYHHTNKKRVYLEMCPTELTITHLQRARCRLRDAFRHWVGPWINSRAGFGGAGSGLSEGVKGNRRGRAIGDQ